MYEPRFVNRVPELENLHKLATRGSALPIFLYGPEGCGKTRLLKEFVKKFNGISIYVDALEKEKLDKALLTNPAIGELRKLMQDLVSKFTGPVGAFLVDKLMPIVENIVTKTTIEDKPLVIIVDDVVRAIGIEKIEWYIKWLYELGKKLVEDYRPSSILIIATTSEGQSLDLVLRHTYASIRLLWNLHKDALDELARELGVPHEVSIDELWHVTGGNPRILIEIAHDYAWNINAWLSMLKKKLLKIIISIKSKGLENELKLVIKDPDAIYHYPSQKMEELYKILVEENLIIYKYIPTITEKEIEEDPELGIGKYYAWQIPAYRDIISNIL